MIRGKFVQDAREVREEQTAVARRIGRGEGVNKVTDERAPTQAQQDHNDGQRDGSRTGVMGMVNAALNPLLTKEYVEGFWEGQSKPKKAD